jgi:HlyD family secretion protein
MQTSEVASKLGLHENVGRRLFLRTAIVILLVILAGLAWVVSRQRKAAAGAVHYTTLPAVRGDLVETVSATGTLAPVKEVEVGSEISGTMKTVEVDYNDRVRVGQVLARIDTAKLEASVLQSEAALEAAQAKVLESEATLQESDAQLTRLKHVRELSGGKVPSQFEFEAQVAAAARARANVASSKAEVTKARATLDLNRSDMEKAVIISPVNGVVLIRQIEPGQTVAASFEAPVLFTLAEDLSQLELQVDVDEADVGQVSEGQEAIFTVDAYPEKRFPAAITQVRYGSKTTEGVVTYTTVLKVNNDDLALRPGMTATAVITTRKAASALLVPSAALRFEPPRAPAAGAGGRKGSLISSLLPHPPRREAKINGAPKAGAEQTVHVLENGELRAVAVTTGLTDGTLSEIKSGSIEPGMAIVTEMTTGSR